MGARFVLLQLLPQFAGGIFSGRRKVMGLLTKLDVDRRAGELLASVREKNPAEAVWLLGGRMLVVFGVDSIKEVLDHSAEVYASDAGAKGKGMTHFQPGALTVSKNGEWEDRRRFNEAVLAWPERVHPQAAHMAAVARDEVGRLLEGPRTELDWDAYHGMLERITLRVVFGDRAREDTDLVNELDALMEEANRVVGTGEGKSDHFEPFYERVRGYMNDPDPESLIARFDAAGATERTRPANQVPHWMFAMKDTLAANSFRALAVLGADIPLQRRVREEAQRADLADPDAVDGMRLLESCLEEAMRLWPTTPLLFREAMRDTTLAGEKVPEGTQVLIVNSFNHRNPDLVEDPDAFKPERFQNGGGDYRFNHLSNGSQVCVGLYVAKFVGKAVMGNLIAQRRIALEEPDLDAHEPMPRMLDFYGLRLRVSAT